MDSSLMLSTGSSALISALLLQYLKNAQWVPWLSIQKASQRANFCASLFMAFIVSLGIGVKFDGASGSLLITGLTAATLMHSLYHMGVQWVAQHVSYKAFVVPSELLAAIVNQLKVLETNVQAAQIAPKG